MFNKQVLHTHLKPVSNLFFVYNFGRLFYSSGIVHIVKLNAGNMKNRTTRMNRNKRRFYVVVVVAVVDLMLNVDPVVFLDVFLA